jgi:TniQ
VAGLALPIAPRPRPDELPSSWLGRTAACYDVSVAEFRQVLWTAGPSMKARPDVEWDPHEAESVAAGLRVALEVVLSLGLKRRWRGLAVDWLPSTDGSGRARGDLDLAWCHHCLAEAHEAGGAYLEAEAALPLVFCHRHGAWRQDYCRRCRPKHAPRFTWPSSIEFVCGDCGTPLRASRWEQPTPAAYFEPEETAAALPILLAFDGEVRNALLGHPACLPGMEPVPARQFLTVLRDLTRALLAPSALKTSYINLFDCPLLPIMPEHKPHTWGEQPYYELSPSGRAHVLSAVAALLADEPVSRLMSGAHLPFRERLTLEKLLNYVPRWVQALLIRSSAGWPARLRVRVDAHQRQTGMDANDVLAQFNAWRAEREQRQRERTSLIG